jgi:DNA-binding CsgD family transcriptional regulator/PAS domain-containing protein
VIYLKLKISGYAQTALILDLIDLIYASVAEASCWPAFLEEFVRAIAAGTATLALHDINREGFSVVCWHGLSDAEIALYNEHYSATDPWGIDGSFLPEGAVHTDFEMSPRKEFEASLAFRQFYAPLNAVHGMGGIILVNSAGRSIIAATRRAEDGPFGETEKSILRPLMPHLKRAALLHGELGSLRAQLATFTGHLDRYPNPFLLIDQERRVLYVNAAAREFATSGGGLVIEAGRLSFRSSISDQQLQRIAATVIARRDRDFERIDVPRPSGRRAYRLLVMRVPNTGALPLEVAQPSIALLIVDADSHAAPDPAMLKELFSLTPAEARVASMLARGDSLEEIAQTTRTAIETVRTHLKRTLAKTATSRQGELISLILRSTPFRI